MKPFQTVDDANMLPGILDKLTWHTVTPQGRIYQSFRTKDEALRFIQPGQSLIGYDRS